VTPPLPPIAVRRLDAADVARWDAFVASFPAATFFHRAGWKTVIEDSFDRPCHFLFAEVEGALKGVLPLVHVKSRLFGNSLVSTGFTVGGGPVAADDRVLAALDREALALADKLDVDVLEYRSGTPQHPDWVHKSDLYASFRKPLDPDPDKTFAAAPKDQRKSVRRGIKFGLVGEIDDGVERLYPVYAESVRNLGTPVFSKRYFRRLYEVFQPDVDVVTIVQGATPVASTMSFYFRDQALPFYGGGTAQARAVSGNDVMIWETMKRAIARGCRIYDFGRSKRGTGSFAYKVNWGFAPEPLTYEYKLRRGDAPPDVNPLNPKYRLFIAAWKRLPLGLSTLLGPMIVRNLA
jgi:FemAB-related protein (PEP-CTERM system-associated)